MTDAPHPEDVSNLFEGEAQDFVQSLVAELDLGLLRLPGFPDTAQHLQILLNDERAEVDQIVHAIGFEPLLAIQILRIANSTTLRNSNPQLSDLRAAVQRMGNRLVRAAALAFFIQKLRNTDDMRALRDPLNALWRRGVVVGAIARALSAHIRGSVPDAALLVGLLHVVGRLYILVRISRTPWLLEQPGMVERIAERLGNQLGKAVLEGWQMDRESVMAILEHDNPDRPLAALPDLTDVLAAAVLLADLLPPSKTDYLDQIHLAQVYTQSEPLWKRLKLRREQCSDALHIALADVQELRAMLGA